MQLTQKNQLRFAICATFVQYSDGSSMLVVYLYRFHHWSARAVFRRQLRKKWLHKYRHWKGNWQRSGSLVLFSLSRKQTCSLIEFVTHKTMSLLLNSRRFFGSRFYPIRLSKWRTLTPSGKFSEGRISLCPVFVPMFTNRDHGVKGREVISRPTVPSSGPGSYAWPAADPGR